MRTGRVASADDLLTMITYELWSPLVATSVEPWGGLPRRLATPSLGLCS